MGLYLDAKKDAEIERLRQENERLRELLRNGVESGRKGFLPESHGPLGLSSCWEIQTVSGCSRFLQAVYYANKGGKRRINRKYERLQEVNLLKQEVRRWSDEATTQRSKKLLIKSKVKALLEAIHNYHNDMSTEMWLEVTDAAKELE